MHRESGLACVGRFAQHAGFVEPHVRMRGDRQALDCRARHGGLYV